MPETTIRPLTPADAPLVASICADSPWVVNQFEVGDLERLLVTRPGVGAFDGGGAMRAWMLATTFTPPYAWLGGFGVPWTERAAAVDLLDDLLTPWEGALRAAGVTTMIYSGNDDQNDWLRGALLARGFQHLANLRAYDKIGTHSPNHGNQGVHVRPIQPDVDVADLLAIEAAAFAPPWRFDERTFREMAATYPFFVVALMPDATLAGYQANLVEDDLGFIVRIAVHPRFQGQGIGSRLLDESMRFFAAQPVERILLNADDLNVVAHRLYEVWGFTLVPPRGFALQRPISRP